MKVETGVPTRGVAARRDGGSGGGNVQSVDRALDLLFLVAGSDSPVSPSQIAAELQLPRPTVYRLADTLIRRGLLGKRANGLVATPKLYVLTSGGRSTLRLRDIVEPILTRLVERTGETAALHVRMGHLRRCVVEVEGYHGTRWARGVGFTVPVWTGAVGHVLLAGLSDQEIERLLADLPLEKRASQTITDRAELLARVRHARAEGWSLSVSETVEGACGIAAPVRRGDRVVAAMSLTAPADRTEQLRDWAPELLAAADQASAEWTRSTSS